MKKFNPLKPRKAIRYSFCVCSNWECGKREDGTGVYLQATYCNNQLTWQKAYGDPGCQEIFPLSSEEMKETNEDFYKVVMLAIKHHIHGEDWPTLLAKPYPTYHQRLAIYPEVITLKGH